jgi:hypothetical protein
MLRRSSPPTARSRRRGSGANRSIWTCPSGDRAGEDGKVHVGRLPRPAGRAPADRGIHDPRQCRRRRDAGGQEAPPLLFRVHEEPPPEKLDALREVAQAAGFTLAKGQVLQTRHLNRLLEQAEGTEFDELINMTTLRAMTQAYYSPRTSGISAWPAQLRAFHLADPPLCRPDRPPRADHGAWLGRGRAERRDRRAGATAEHISETERRSMAAERDTTDRYLAAYLADRVGNEFAGRISGCSASAPS